MSEQIESELTDLQLAVIEVEELGLPRRDAIKLVTQRVGFFVGQQRYTEELAKARKKLAGQAETSEGTETARADGNEPLTLPPPRFRVSATHQIGSTGG
jgi:hypothetical protein